MATITNVTEGKRGCGYRKGGGIYLMGGEVMKSCGLLPLILKECECCGRGIEFSRRPHFIKMKYIMQSAEKCRDPECKRICPPFDDPERSVMIMWIGKQHYPTPQHFTAEAKKMGISRRITSVPKGLVVGETWIVFAHVEGGSVFEKAEAEMGTVEKKVPAIFSAFIPNRIEYIVKGDETEEELDQLEKRGLTLVRVTNPDNGTQTHLDPERD